MDRGKFYKEYREQWGGIKKESTVDSINALLDEFEKNKPKIKPIEKMAYMLATVRHECGPHMNPITENLRYSARRLTQVWPSRFPSMQHAKPYAYNPQLLGNKVYGGRLGNGHLEGYLYRGRGFVQITGHTNYKKFTDLLDVDLVDKPELALDKSVGAMILRIGMEDGLFTGKKLSGSINSRRTDYYSARDIVNADKKRVGHNIAKDAEKFEKILRSALDK